MVMPNHFCKHCKHKNLFTEADCIETSGKTILEKRLLAKRIHEELTIVEKRILKDSENQEGGDLVEDVEVTDLKVNFKKPGKKGVNQDLEKEVDLIKDF